MVWLIASTAGVHVLGVAGYRGGFFWALLIVAGGGGLATAWATRRRDDRRWAWVAAAAVVGAACAGWLFDHAPPSTGRLVAILDDLKLDGVRALSTHREGHSWCRPTCPSVTRTYQPTVGRRGALVLVGVALQRAGLVRPSSFAAAKEGFSGGDENVAVAVRLTRSHERDAIVVQLRAKR